MAEQFLNSTDVVAVFQQMCGEAVPECVTTRGLCNARVPDRQFHSVLEIFLADMMTADLVRARIGRQHAGRVRSQDHR